MPKQGPGKPDRQFPKKDVTLEKALPSNIEAERLILGVILLDNSMINQAVERLRPDDLFLGSHRLIYSKMIKLYEGGLGIDPITLQEELRKAGELDAVGGPAYIASLFDGVPRFSNIDNYTKIVKGKGTLRKLITASNQIMALAFDDEDDPEIILDEAERLILAIGEDRIKQGFVHVGEVAGKQLEVIEEIAGRGRMVTGIPTGFIDLDQLTSGLQRGDLIIIAARPSMGKCLAADTEIVLSDGRIATIEEIYHRRDARLITLCDDFKFSSTSPTAFVDDGIKPVYRVTTRLGRSVDSTLSHPYLTIDGWRQLINLKVGDRIALPRRIDIFGKEQLAEGKVKLLAYLIGDGNLTNTNPSLTNTNPVLQRDFAEATGVFPGLKIRAYNDGKRAPAFYVSGDTEFIRSERNVFADRLRKILVKRGAARALSRALGVSPSLVCMWQKGECAPHEEYFKRICEHLNVDPQVLIPSGLAALHRDNRNPLTHWLEDLGLRGCNAHEKFIPPIIFQLTKPLISLFLNRLFATDGWVALNKGQNATIGYATVSKRLARQVQHLLLRFGIIAKLRKREIKYSNKRCTSWQLDITNAISIRTFSAEIGILGKEEKLAQALETLSRENNRNIRDLVPVAIWEEIAEAKGAESWASLARRAGLKGYTNIHAGQRALGRQRLHKIAQALGNEHLGNLAQSDVYWDEIISIEYLSDKQVYDLTIPKTHNFVANDICVHNTAFGLNIAQNAALARDATGRRYEGIDKAVVGIFSLEMSKEQLVQRLLCSQAGVDAHRLRSGFLSKEEWRKLATAVGELAEAPIYLDDSPGISVLEMRAKARRLKNELKRLDLLIVDYLQLMSGRGRYESRQQEVSQISRELKILAKELNVPLIALSQLSRAPETRTGSHKPQLSDLRESGSIEQDADVVMFIYREEVYKQETEKQNIAEIIIGKQRNGPVDTVELVFLKQFTRFGPKYQE